MERIQQVTGKNMLGTEAAFSPVDGEMFQQLFQSFQPKQEMSATGIPQETELEESTDDVEESHATLPSPTYTESEESLKNDPATMDEIPEEKYEPKNMTSADWIPTMLLGQTAEVSEKPLLSEGTEKNEKELSKLPEGIEKNKNLSSQELSNHPAFAGEIKESQHESLTSGALKQEIGPHEATAHSSIEEPATVLPKNEGKQTSKPSNEQVSKPTMELSGSSIESGRIVPEDGTKTAVSPSDKELSEAKVSEPDRRISASESVQVNEGSETIQRSDSQSMPIDPSVQLAATKEAIPLTVDVQKLTQGNTSAIEKTVETMAQPIREELQTMVRPNEKIITFDLDPEQLGKVQVKMKVTPGAVSLELTVQSEQTKKMFESLTTSLDKILQKQENVPVFSVMKTETPANVSAGENQMNFSGSFQEGFSQEQRHMQQQQRTSGKYSKQILEEQPTEKEIESQISILA
ncbi:flagellar hook-length control protein FliK [Enterococcus olivae]